jgi:hypothetical protein
MARRFEATEATTLKELRSVLAKMKATSMVIRQEFGVKDVVEIIFDRAGRRYIFRGEKYSGYLDNLRAVQLTISYLYRALEEYGVTSANSKLDSVFAQFFLGFEATPDDSALLLGDSGQWWIILGVSRDASKDAVINAYKALAKIHHPDAGGAAADFQRLRRAYEQAIEEIGKR